jgi:hypothetical protein
MRGIQSHGVIAMAKQLDEWLAITFLIRVSRRTRRLVEASSD